MRDAYRVKNTQYDIRNTHDESSYLPSLEQRDGQCQYRCCVAQGVRSTYYDIFYRDLAALVNGVTYPENLQVRH